MDPSYPDDKGDMVNLQTEANLIAPNGVPVFLGDSMEDGDDEIMGAVQFETTQLNYDVSHLQLATNIDIYNMIIGNPQWSP
jgi:hypothetical protein